MAVPKYYEFFPCIIRFLSDNSTHTMKEILECCAAEFNLSEDDKNERTSSGQLTFVGRVSWACVYLKKAGLATSPKRGYVAITEEGQIAYKNGAEKVDRKYLYQFDSFMEFKGKTGNKKEKQQIEDDVKDDESPEEMLDSAVKKLNASLADDLLDEIMKISPYSFEKLVVNLLFKMGYGKPKDNPDAVTAKSGDEGIDGIVSADKFGFDSIYIQAKQWKTDSTVSRPEIQKFLGALAGQGATKGIFITTAQFSKEAKVFADKQLHSKIILVDGQDLAELMIEYNLGVSTNRVYEVKRIDTDYFNEYE